MIENVGRRSSHWSEEGAPPDVGDHSLNGYERNSLFWNLGGGRFADVGYLTASNRLEDGRGVAVADFDRDGLLDLAIQNLDKPAVLLMGRGDAGNWLQIALEGTTSHRDAIGARVQVLTGESWQTRQVAAGSGYLSSSSRVLHFGLGQAAQADAIEIHWPSGRRQLLLDTPANQRIAVREGVWSPGDEEPSSRP